MKNLKELIRDKNVWIKNPDNVFYLTNFHSSNLNLFYVNKKWYAITDDRYFIQAKDYLTDFIVLNMSEKPFKKIILEKLLNTEDKALYLDFDFLTVNQKQLFNKKYPKIKLKNLKLSQIRMIKSKNEIDKIKKACEITDQIFYKFIKFIKPEISEKEALKYLKQLIIASEADAWSFEPIIASGQNGANPHYSAGDDKLKANKMLTVDFGVIYHGYVSDMTRTFSIKEVVSAEEEKIHRLVLEAMDLAIANAKPGIKISELEQMVREYLKKEDYEKYFIHSLGHGIGINVHEEPWINASNDLILEKDMIITIEPGIYVPDKYGCRIEQDILITDKDALQLNKSRTDLYLI